MGGDDRTFRVDFSSNGVARLRERVREKLKEYMGDYTDDTLVEYVIVLLKNGRNKDEAKSELDVFLGDDSDSFVSWLWDHLGSYLNLYVQQRECHETPKTESKAREQDGRTESHHIESTAAKGHKISDRCDNRPVKDGDEEENPIPQNSVTDNVNAQDELHQRVGSIKQSSPQLTTEKKRRRRDERRSVKSEVSQTTVSAPRRLLQFAVRDAVATSRPSNTESEPSRKRLRSIVSTSTGDSFLRERPHRTRPEFCGAGAMSVAIKAMAEAVKDANKVRPAHSVFDRLGHDNDVSKSANHVKVHRGVAEDGEGGEFSNEKDGIHLAYQQLNGDNLHQEINPTSFNDDTIMPSDVGYDEGYNVDAMGPKDTHMFQRSSSGGDWVEDDSQLFQYDLPDRADSRVQNLGQHVSVPRRSLKVASSINMNAQKSQYQEGRKASELDGENVTPYLYSMSVKSQALLARETSDFKEPYNRNVKPDTALQHEPQKTETPAGLYSTGPPTEDADARTIFVINVHFAATKDSLSRHFNKFGEVLKVIILTEPSTGQPKGSAYIEFMRKEAAEQALSLDGTSFMSRILKIVRKSSAQPEMASSVTWPWVARGSPFPVPRGGRVPFARGFPNVYRGRIPTKPGPRSFQWKREAQPTVTPAPGQASSSIAQSQPPTRSLTYVRTEAKALSRNK